MCTSLFVQEKLYKGWNQTDNSYNNLIVTAPVWVGITECLHLDSWRHTNNLSDIHHVLFSFMRRAMSKEGVPWPWPIYPTHSIGRCYTYYIILILFMYLVSSNKIYLVHIQHRKMPEFTLTELDPKFINMRCLCHDWSEFHAVISNKS